MVVKNYKNGEDWYILTPKQKRFLIYITENHFGLGWTPSIKHVIEKGGYNDNLKDMLRNITKKFEGLKNGNDTDCWNVPKKYLK
jgi:hypothetical protein